MNDKKTKKFYHLKDYNPMNRRKFVEGKSFSFNSSGEEYKQYFLDRRNNYIMTHLGIEVYRVTKITLQGFYYRGFTRLDEDYHETDRFENYKNLTQKQ